MYAIKTEKLTKYYGKHRGITDVSLNIEEGDFFGFIGPNGAGKSTTIRTLLGLISPSSGSAEILGKNIAGNKTDILKDIGYLPSDAAFYSGMRVKDILELSASLRGVDCRSEAEALCKRLELDVTRKIDELSLGNRKKVGIVCALQHKPKLYVLDEPTSGLDPLMQREFYAILRERNEEGATVFLSSHILSEVAKYCKHAAVIREGRILVSDSIEKLGHTGVKKVSLRGVDDDLSIDGVNDIKRENDTVNFLYEGKPSELLNALSGIKFDDINISDPDLDEIFMHFYIKEET